MPEPNTPIIEVAELTYEYPGQRALDAVSFTIDHGSITALVGPNGAGKTTLLRCLAGMDQPLRGDIRIAGIDVVEEPRRSHAVIGYLPDSFGLYANLSVRRGLSYVAAANGVARAQIHALVEGTAAELGLADRLEQRAGALSRGLRQRLAIAQAIIHAPRVILLDEPAAGLDPEARYRLGELFVALGRRGLTLLVSSHILAELEAYSTDMLILDGGRLLEQRRLRSPAGHPEMLTIGTIAASDRLLSVLAAHEQVSEVTVMPDHAVRCRFAGGAAERAALLAELVGQAIPITHFAVADEDLQDSYLRSFSRPGPPHEP
ncbi:MAG: ABC transporter ATP-binding protein [Gammaproteobacteria bacterium]